MNELDAYVSKKNGNIYGSSQQMIAYCSTNSIFIMIYKAFSSDIDTYHIVHKLIIVLNMDKTLTISNVENIIFYILSNNM